MADDNAPPPPPPPPSDDAPPQKPKPNAQEIGSDHDPETGTSTAKGGGTDSLGQQVNPATQSSEADGHRTLVNPVVDPGPYIHDGRPDYAHPDRSKGEHRISDSNDPIGIRMRTSTGHDLGFARHSGDVVTDSYMPPDNAISGAASDMYHPHTAETAENGASLTAEAQKLAAQPRTPAPTRE